MNVSKKQMIFWFLFLFTISVLCHFLFPSFPPGYGGNRVSGFEGIIASYFLILLILEKKKLSVGKKVFLIPISILACEGVYIAILLIFGIVMRGIYNLFL